jgi:hypothetical protein
VTSALASRSSSSVLMAFTLIPLTCRSRCRNSSILFANAWFLKAKEWQNGQISSSNPKHYLVALGPLFVDPRGLQTSRAQDQSSDACPSDLPHSGEKLELWALVLGLPLNFLVVPQLYLQRVLQPKRRSHRLRRIL